MEHVRVCTQLIDRPQHKNAGFRDSIPDGVRRFSAHATKHHADRDKILTGTVMQVSRDSGVALHPAPGIRTQLWLSCFARTDATVRSQRSTGWWGPRGRSERAAVPRRWYPAFDRRTD